MHPWKKLMIHVGVVLMTIAMGCALETEPEPEENDIPLVQPKPKPKKSKVKRKHHRKSKTKSHKKRPIKSNRIAQPVNQPVPQPMAQPRMPIVHPMAQPNPIPVALPKPQAKPKQLASPIIGEIVDTDTIPLEDEDFDPNAFELPSPKPKISKLSSQVDKENEKHKKIEKKREQILKGFHQAQQFHRSWHNLPPLKVKSSHENLIKFCKVACTKKYCIDEKVANNCHLMCPDHTTKQCPDPLKQVNLDADEPEVTIGNAMNMPEEKELSSIELAEKNISEDEGEGG